MRSPTEARPRGGWTRPFSAPVITSALAVAVALSGPAPVAAQEPRTPTFVPEDDELDAALESLDHAQPLQAEATLRALAERGSVPAMERLAMMHFHGESLYGPGPWRRDEAWRWFARAADRGSPIGQAMVRKPAATGLSTARR